MRREDVTIQLEYWTYGSASVRVRDRQGRELISLVGEGSGSTLGGYPRYSKVTINGITELIEHRRMEPIFYVSDDAELRRRFGVK